MEQVRCVRKKVQEDPDPKLKDPDPKLKGLECPVEAEEEDNVGGGAEEIIGGAEGENDGGGDSEEEDGDTEEEDSDDEGKAWDEKGEPCLPYIGAWDEPMRSCTAGASYTEEEVSDIESSVNARHDQLFDEWCEMVDNKRTPSPVQPLYFLPKVTIGCASGYECYHRRYWTEITSETSSTHPYFRPCGMMQLFSLRLPRPVAHPVNVYGSFSIRDCWEPLRNYLFRRSRDDPATIPEGCSFLPLRSPCRGIYVVQYTLVDVDLWIKEEGDGSADQQLFCGCVELDTSLAVYGLKLQGRFHGDCHCLDMHYAYVWDSIETVIEVLAEAEHSSDVRFSALTSGFDDEVELYDGAFCGRGRIFRHFVAVKKLEKFDVILKTNESLYKWTFQAGVGVVVAPEHPVSGFAQYFVMNVSFRTRGKAASAWQWSCICKDVRVTETCL